MRMITLLFLLLLLSASLHADTFSDTVNTAIPDNNVTGISRTLSVVDPITITDVNVAIDITHSWRNDLYVTLTSPTGRTVILQNRTGGSEDDLKVTFDTGAIPDQSLVAFNGEDGQGIWTIHVSDREGGDTGTFNSWSLIVEGYLGNNYSTVTGSIRYEDRILTGSGFSGTTEWKPVRYADVELVRQSDGLSIGSARTDGSGAYSLAVERQGVIEVYLRVYARSVTDSQLVQVLDDTTSKALHTVVNSASNRDTNADFSISLDAPYSAGSGPAGAFNILDTVQTGQSLVTSYGATRPPLLTCYWEQGSTDGTYYSSSKKSLHILGSTSDTDEFDDSVIMHELGHYIADVYSIDTSPGGSHTWSEEHQDLRLAWSEGWANYFSSLGRNDPEYLDSYNGGVTQLEIETPSHASTALGQDNESAVHSILWDLYDKEDTPDSSVGTDDDPMTTSVGGEAIWKVFQSQMATGFNTDVIIFEGFYNGWVSLHGPGYFLTEFEEIAASRNVTFDRYYLWSDDADRAIPDQGQAIAPIDVSADLTLTEVNVFLQLEHTYPGDLIISLKHPDGTTVRLHNRSSGTASQAIVAWYEADEATPADSLSVFNGKGATGQWQLVISDNAANDTGTLKLWKLHLEGTPGTADLVVDSISGPTAATRGQQATVTGRVRNRGGQAVAGQFYESYYLSTDRTITTTDTFLGSFTVSGLAAGATSENARTVSIPGSLPTGVYYLGMLVDWDGATGTVSEAIEVNNDGVAATSISLGDPSAGIDLYAASIDGPASATSGTTIPVAVVISNGGGNSAGAFVNRYYLSTDTFINAAEDTLLASYSWAALGFATSQSENRVVTVPASLAAGTYYLGVIVDADGQVTETNEANNIGVDAQSIALSEPVSGVDLVVTEFLAPASATMGTTVSVSSAIRNDGTSAATSFTETYYLSPDAVIDGTGNDENLASWTLGTLASAATTTASREFTLPATTVPGNYYLGLLVTSAQDTITANNASVREFTVAPASGADLTPTNVQGPTTIWPGSIANITYSVGNVGSSDADAMFVDFYLSTDANITTTDVYVARVNSPAITGGSGGTYTITTTVPQTVPTGTYYLGCIVDASNLVTETNETNNVLAASSTLLATDGDRPDLSLYGLSASGSTNAGASLNVTWRVRNTGEAATPGSFTSRFYLSLDQTPSVTDIAIGDHIETGNLLPGADLYRSTILTIPTSVASASYYLWATADAAAAISETTETNNFVFTSSPIAVSGTISGIDLTVASVTTPTTVSVGNPMFVTAIVANNGQTAVPSATQHRVEFYISTDQTISAADTLITSVTLTGMGAGASVPLTLLGNVPAALTPGDYYLGALVDAGGQVSETNESNNAGASSTTFTVQVTPTLADLIPLLIDGPEVAPVGGTFDVNTVFANYGNTAAPAPFIIRFVLTADAIVDGSDPVIGLYPQGAAVPGTTSTTAICPCTVNSFISPGVYGLGLILDDLNAITESNETNNTIVSNGTITITAVSQPPDLICTDVEISLWGRVGGLIGVERTLRNIGQQNAKKEFQVIYYLSSDVILDGGDTYLGSFTMQGLDMGAEDQRLRSVQIPSTVGPGSYWVIVKVDGDNDIIEGIETNNTRLSDNKVTVSGSPDLTIDSVSATTPVSVASVVTITRSIRNPGTAALTRPVAIRYYLSNDAVINFGTGGDTILYTETYYGGLAAGASTTGTTQCVVPAHVSPWDYYIGAYVDVVDSILEEDETNNVTVSALTTMTVDGAPDLRALSVSAVSTGVQGTPITVSISVQNYQNTTSPASTANIRLSTNTGYDVSDAFVGAINIDGLAPLENRIFSSTFTIPASAVGNLYSVAWVDPETNGSINETVEGYLSNSVVSPTSSTYTVPDTTAPTANISYWQNGVEIMDTENIPAGNLQIVAHFAEELMPTPNISLNQEGTGDIPATTMTGVIGNAAIWLFSYTVNDHDGGVNQDGWVDLSFTNARDLQGNSFAAGVADSFRVDTIPPAIVVTSPTLEYPAARINAVNYTLAGTLTDASTVTATYSLNYSPPVTLPLINKSFNLPMTYTGAASRQAPDIVIVQSKDLAGNAAMTQVIQVTLDSDNDGIADWYELQYPSVLNPAVPGDAGNDPDGDGLTNIEEYQNGTVPTVSDNTVPIADAGPDQSGGVRLVILDGRNSHTNPVGGALTYNWSFVSGPVPNVSLLPSSTSATPNFNGIIHGTYTFSLQVHDGVRLSTPDLVNVTISNTPPMAHAGFDSVAPVSVLFNLDGSRSLDPEAAGALTYLWTEDTDNPVTGLLVGANTATPNFTPPQAGQYVFYLDVDDFEGEPATQTASVTVLVVNTGANSTPPYANGGPLRSVNVSSLARLDGRVSADPDPAGITDWWWTLVEGPATTLTFQDQPQVYASIVTRGAYRLALSAEDSIPLTSPRAIGRILAHTPTNKLPKASAGSDIRSQLGQVVTLNGSASADPEGGTLYALWQQLEGPPVVLSNVNVLSPSFGPTVAERYRFRLHVSDVAGTWQDFDDTVVVVSPAANQPPLASARIHPVSDPDADGRVAAGGPVFLDASASTDVDGPSPLTVRWVQTSGPWVALSDPTLTQPNFTPPIIGRYTFDLIAYDGAAETRATVNVLAEIGPVGPPTASARLSLASDPDGDSIVNGYTGQALTLDGTASFTKPTGGTLYYQWQQIGGPWVVFDNPESATPSFTPSGDGIYTFELVVYDGQAPSVPVYVNVTVTSASSPGAVVGGGGGGGGGGCTLSGNGQSSPFAFPFILLLPIVLTISWRRRGPVRSSLS